MQARDPEYFRDGDVAIPPEPNPRTSAKWRPSRVLSLKYVDDSMAVKKLNYETADQVGSNTRVKHAVGSQNIFRAVVKQKWAC